jgi:hypothetical protein
MFLMGRYFRLTCTRGGERFVSYWPTERRAMERKSAAERHGWAVAGPVGVDMEFLRHPMEASHRTMN